MCVGADRDPKGSGQAEVSQLDLSLGVDQKVLGLQITMKNPVRVAEGHTLQQLEQITLQTHKQQIARYASSEKKHKLIQIFLWIQFKFYLHQRQWETVNRGCVHEFFQILVEELEHKVEFVLRVDYILQPESEHMTDGWRGTNKQHENVRI